MPRMLNALTKRLFVPEEMIGRMRTGEVTARIVLRPVNVRRGPILLTSGISTFNGFVDTAGAVTLSQLTDGQCQKAGYASREDFEAKWGSQCRKQGAPLEERKLTLVQLFPFRQPW